ncbi:MULTISPECIES: ROK family transcriptional regulator [unclassified Oceanobacillus]|uniref:ROK family transcriptional regulator n=1 Tax=unclassified Oceanobacillus TaxID=2630292 RepID=UPI00300DC153
MKKSTPQLVKMMNRELIIDELRRNPKQSRADLSKKTKLSKPTISEIVRELLDEELILETGVGESSGGKKPIYLKYNSRFNFVVSILIENDSIHFALGDMSGEILTLFKQKFIPHSDGTVIIDSIEEGVERLLELEKVTMDKVLGMVVGVSGIKMDSDDMIRSSPTIRWGNTNLRKELSSRLKVDVIIENDVNLMTIGEFYKGQGQNIANFVYLFIGNGIGSGLFLNEKFYKGSHSASGEVGFMMIGDENNIKQELGVFETNYGLFGVSERLRELEVNLATCEADSLLHILQYHQNDARIKEILEETIDHWAKAAINLISIIDPQAVILSGELVNMNQTSLHAFKQKIERFVPQMPEIKVTELGSKAGIYGAFHLGLAEFHVAGFKYKK